MDSAGPAESSNSPNDRVVVRIDRGAKGERSIILSDGSFFCVSGVVLSAERLAIGTPVDEQRRAELERSSALSGIRAKALMFLSRRDHTARQLGEKLQRRGHPDGLVRETIEKLQAQGVLNERRYCENWIRWRLKKHPEGRHALLAGLLNAGIDRHTAHQTLDALLTDELEARALDRAAEALARRTGMTRDKMLRSLATRGFSISKAQRRAAAVMNLPEDPFRKSQQKSD